MGSDQEKADMVVDINISPKVNDKRPIFITSNDGSGVIDGILCCEISQFKAWSSRYHSSL